MHATRTPHISTLSHCPGTCASAQACLSTNPVQMCTLPTLPNPTTLPHPPKAPARRPSTRSRSHRPRSSPRPLRNTWRTSACVSRSASMDPSIYHRISPTYACTRPHDMQLTTEKRTRARSRCTATRRSTSLEAPRLGAAHTARIPSRKRALPPPTRCPRRWREFSAIFEACGSIGQLRDGE